MSLYSIAAASLTTIDDRTRRPGIGAGQIARTLMFCLLAAAALVLMHQRSHAAWTALQDDRSAPTQAAFEPH